MSLILLLFQHMLSEIRVDVIGTKLFISGDGAITPKDVQSKGDFKSISDIIIEEGPTIIKTKAFQRMASLQTVNFSKSIQIIEDEIFWQNGNLKQFIVDPGSKYFYSDGKSLYSYNRTVFYKAVNRPGSIILDQNTEIMMSNSLCSCSIQTLTIPSKVKQVGSAVFVDSTLSEVIFEERSSLTIIPYHLYYSCVITKLHIASSVTTISSDAFEAFSCDEIIFDDINNSAFTTLMSSAFAGIQRISSLTLPPRVTSLPDNCFKGSPIKSVNIPRDCISVSKGAFNGCTELISMSVDTGNTAYKMLNSTLYNINETQIVFISPNVNVLTISAKLEQISTTLVQTLKGITVIEVDKDNNVYSGEDGCLYNKDKTTLIGVCGGVKELNVSASTELIGENAGIEVGITSVTFRGNKVNTIDQNAFKGCKNLTHIELAYSITKIHNSAFMQSGLKSINLSNVSSLGNNCFYGTPLSTVVITKSLSECGYGIFEGCKMISSFTFEAEINIHDIFDSMFVGAGLVGAKLQIPKSVEHIRKSAFAGSSFLISIESGSILSSIEESSFEGCLIEGEFEVPSTLKHIGVGSFIDCRKLTGIKFIGECNLQTIGNSAFKRCSALRSFFVPPTLQRFDQSVFSECFNLSEVTGKFGNTNLSVANNIIYNSDLTELIICPPGLATASVQSSVSSIASNAFYNCRILTNVVFSPPSRVKTLNENVFAECVRLSTIVLPQSIESLSNKCFENCVALSSVKFEGSGNEGSHLKKLMDSTFKGCSNLNSITFQSPQNFVSIGESTFEGCSRLALISLPSSVKSIGPSCFKQSGLQSIELDSLTSIGDGAFSGCLQLQKASLKGVASIPNNLFDGCTFLAEFDFFGHTAIGSRSFGCCNFERLVISIGVASIGESAFADNVALTSVNISSSVSSIGSGCFAGCPGLLEIIYCGRTKMGENNCGLEESKAVLYVTQEFPHESFCRSHVRKQLDSSCGFLPPTQTNTFLFSAQTEIGHCISLLFGADAMCDSCEKSG